MAGYSKNPLWKKLGIKEHFKCYLYNSPENYFDLLEAIPAESVCDDTLSNSPYDFLHVFVKEEKDLNAHWKEWKSNMKKDGTLWISWPKGTSQIMSDLNGNLVREFGLKGGLVDVKVCAIDDDWSGLKFMYRKIDR